MKISFLFIFGAGALALAILLTLGVRRRRDHIDGGTAKVTKIIIAALASVNISGIFGLGWFAVTLLVYDGVMFMEHTICAVLITVLALITAGAFSLSQRGRIGAAVALLAVAALSVIAAYGFLIYLDIHPIDMR